MSNQNKLDEGDLDDGLNRLLRLSGDLSPITEGDLLDLITQIPMDTEIPEKFADPFFIIDTANKNSTIIHIDTTNNTEIQENLAQAAREGKIISDNVKKRMEQDRKNAENEEPTEG